MGHLSTTRPFTCVTCEIEIAGPATFHLGVPFCCAGCAAGGSCACSHDGGPTESRIRHCLDVRHSLDVQSAAGGGAARRIPEIAAAGRR